MMERSSASFATFRGAFADFTAWHVGCDAAWIVKSKTWSGALSVTALGAALFIHVAGCAADKPPAPHFIATETKVQAAPARVMPPVVAASPSVNVSAELAAACNLKFNNADNAPKFDFDGSQLGADDNDVLTQIAKCVTTGPLSGRALDLVGRADSRGTGAYNKALGDRRAATVQTYLSGQGVSSSNLAMSSRGERDATGTDEAGWQRDRRVDVLLH
jgi:peptidoglycan-associated lipoprotein